MRTLLRGTLLLALSLAAAGCELIGDIFQAGVAVGIILIFLLIVVIGWLIARFRGRG